MNLPIKFLYAVKKKINKKIEFFFLITSYQLILWYWLEVILIGSWIFVSLHQRASDRV